MLGTLTEMPGQRAVVDPRRQIRRIVRRVFSVNCRSRGDPSASRRFHSRDVGASAAPASAFFSRQFSEVCDLLHVSEGPSRYTLESYARALRTTMRSRVDDALIAWSGVQRIILSAIAISGSIRARQADCFSIHPFFPVRCLCAICCRTQVHANSPRHCAGPRSSKDSDSRSTCTFNLYRIHVKSDRQE